MSYFPENPSDGDVFTTALGTEYQFNLASQSWRIVSQDVDVIVLDRSNL